MKTKIKMTIMAVAVSIFLPTAVVAQGWLVTLDEYGHGTYTSNGVPTLFSGELLPDPSGALQGSVLVYTLPFNFQQAGDYYMTNSQEPLPLNTSSDVLRFWGVNQVIFYSDTNGVPELGELADTGLPPSLMSPNVGLLETGAEGGFQDALHQTIAGDPGFAGLVGGLGITYDFISDVPEPSSLLLVAAGFTGWMFFRRQRQGR